MAKPTSTENRRSRVRLAVLVAALAAGVVAAIAGAAFADNLTSDAATTAGITTVTAGDSTTITYQLIANNSPSGDPSGCDASTTSPVTVTVNVPPGASATPSSFQFTGCGSTNKQTVSFTSSTAGTYNITHSISGGISGSEFRDNADFTLTVNAATPTNTAPTLTLPSDITAEATSSAGAVVTYSVSASDTEDGSLTPTCNPASGSTFTIGLTQVNCSVTDSGSLTTSGLFNVTVQDTTPPSLTLPADITAEATGPSGAAVSYTASASDLVDGSVAVTCAPASGSTFALGTTTVNCSATDAHSNTAHDSFNVTVQDTTPPTLNLPANITTNASGNSAAAVTYTASASDLVDGPVAVNCTPVSGSSFSVGTTTVNCSATDSHNNTATGHFTVTVNYNWGTGFFQPVDNPDTCNTVKAGSAIPVKFSLGGYQGMNILASGSPVVQAGSCTGDPVDAIETTVTAGNSSLSYDATTDQYIYVWKTDKNWAGTSKRLTVTLADGTSHYARFNFTK
jgi:HYR domain